jgi:hypothetical protein
LENGKLYVPCENEIFEYKEPPVNEKTAPQKPKTLDEKLKSAKEKAKKADAQKPDNGDKKKKHDERE